MELIYKVMFAFLSGACFFYFVDLPLFALVFLMGLITSVFLISKKYKINLNIYSIKEYLLLLIIFLLVGIEYSFFVDRNLPVVSKNYKIYGNLLNKRIEAITINNKVLKNKVYINIKDIAIKNGSYNFIVKIIKANRNGEAIFCNGEIISQDEGFSNKFRNYLRDRIFDISYKYDDRLYGFLLATLIGEGDFLEKEMQEKFKYTGVAHVIVISGSHIAIVIALVLWILGLLNVEYKVKYIVALFILTLYIFVLGFSESIVRAYIMGVIFLISKIFNENADIGKSFAISICISLFINPASLFSVSFLLSYLAVAGMVFIFPLLNRWKDNYLIELILMSCVIQIILAPVFLKYFHKISIFSFISNIAAIPVGAVIVQLGFIGLLFSLIFPKLSWVIGWIIDILVKIFYFYVDLFSSIPFMQINFYERTGTFVMIAICFSIFFVIMYNKIDMKNRVLICTALIFVTIFFDTPKTINYLEVGQNKITRTGNGNNILIVNKEITEKDIFTLKDNGIDKIDVIVYNKENIRFDKLNKIYKVPALIKLKYGKMLKYENLTFLIEDNKIEIM